ncbi:MAG: hypothetical protein IPM69_02630 [Ignavibacteria bacterium]|nr:hypothetical protein [Ignavibacteria bacterium]
MNRSLRCIIAVAAVSIMPLAMFAQIKVVTSTKPNTTTGKRELEPVSTAHHRSTTTKSHSSKILAGEVTVLEKLRNAFSYYTEGSPFVYEDGSKAYFRVQRGPTEDTKGNLYLMTSTDGGKTWSAPNKYYDATQEGQARYPSVQVINKNKSTNLDDLSYIFYAPILTPKGSSSATFGGVAIGFKLGKQPADFFAYQGPENDNPENQQWNVTTSWATDQSTTTSYMVQVLRSSETTQYGRYGVLGLSADAGEIAATNIPSQWDLSHYRASNLLNSRTTAEPHIGIDEEGTLYTLVYNEYTDNEQVRLPSISKSTDGGKNWSELSKMPESILKDYITAGGGDAALIAPDGLGYNSSGFVVYGKDKFSFIAKINDRTAAENVQLVEFYHENGTWGIRKVATLSGFVPSFIYESSVPGTDTAGASQMDNEIQYVRTADGHLLVKYLDFTKHMFAGAEIDASDIFYAYRPMSSNKWSDPGNITNDAFFDKISWIPTSLPNIKDIPLIQMRTVSTEDPETNAYLQDQRDIDDEQEIIQRFFTPAPVGVEEDVNPAGLALRDAKPNPATNSVEIPFSVERSIETRIDLFTALGEKVATVQSGMTAPGFHAVVLSTDNLVSGTYYYTLTAGTAKQTKMLTIIR